MRKGKKITPEIQWAIIRLSRLLSNDDISVSLELSTHTVRRVLSHFSSFGTIPYSDKDDEEPTQDKPRSNQHLRDLDVEVSKLKLSS